LASASGAIKTVADAEALGLSVAQDLMAQGASDLLP
jgi:hydroxymethylbilane synthase